MPMCLSNHAVTLPNINANGAGQGRTAPINEAPIGRWREAHASAYVNYNVSNQRLYESTVRCYKRPNTQPATGEAGDGRDGGDRGDGGWDTTYMRAACVAHFKGFQRDDR